MRAVKALLPDGTEMLTRVYGPEDAKNGWTPGTVEVDMRGGPFGRTWIPVRLLAGDFEVEEPPRSKQETAEHYQRLAEEAAGCEQGPTAA